MSSLAKHFSDGLVGFFSYSREDDEDFDAALSSFRNAIQVELAAQLGRNRSNFRIWQDKFAIPHGAPWRKEISDAINQSVFFVPIVTPRAVGSTYCAFEFESFLAREMQLGREDLIFPILYIPVPDLDDGTWQQNPVLKIVKERQYLDWRDYRPRELSDSVIRAKLIQFCSNIANALRLPWEPQPPQPEANSETSRPAVSAECKASAAGAADAGAVLEEIAAEPTRRVEQIKREKPRRTRPRRPQDNKRTSSLPGEPAERKETEPAGETAPKSAVFMAGAPTDQQANVSEEQSSSAARPSAASQAKDTLVAQSGGPPGLSQLPERRLRSARMLAGFALVAILLAGGIALFEFSRVPSQLKGATAPANGSTPPQTQIAAAPSPASPVAIPPASPRSVPEVPSQSPPLATAAPLGIAKPSNSVSGGSPNLVMWAACRPGNTRVPGAIGGELQPVDTLKLTVKPRSLRTIAVSPDGLRIVSAGDDGTIRIWNAANLKWLHEVHAGNEPIYSVAFSADGSLLASASWDGSVRVWNANTFAPKATFRASDDNGPVKQNGVEFAPANNARFIASAGQDGNVWIWDLQDASRIRKWGDSNSPVRSLSFAPNNSGALVTASFDGKLRFFTEDQKIRDVPVTSGKLLHVAYSPKGNLVASVGVDSSRNVLKLWDAATRTLRSSYTAAHDGANSLAWSRDSEQVAVGEGASKKQPPAVDLWDLKSGARTVFMGHTEDVEAVAFHPNRKWMISASEDGIMKIWNMADGKELLSLAGFADGQFVAYAPSGCYTGSNDASKFVTYVTSGPDAHDTHDNGKNSMFIPADSTEVLLPH